MAGVQVVRGCRRDRWALLTSAAGALSSFVPQQPSPSPSRLSPQMTTPLFLAETLGSALGLYKGASGSLTFSGNLNTELAVVSVVSELFPLPSRPSSLPAHDGRA